MRIEEVLEGWFPTTGTRFILRFDGNVRGSLPFRLSDQSVHALLLVPSLTFDLDHVSALTAFLEPIIVWFFHPSRHADFHGRREDASRVVSISDGG